MNVKLDRHGADLAQEATVLLSMSVGAWSSASGVLDTWETERLLNEGRRRYHGHAPEAAGDDPDTLSPLEARSRCQFWARAAPWYLRLKRDTGIPRPDRRDYEEPDDVVVSGATWFARYNERKSQSNEGHVGIQIGVENLDLLLLPHTLGTAISATSAEETSLAGRSAIALRIEPTETLVWGAPGLVALGADSYVLVVDRQVGILLAAHTYLDGQLARSYSLSALTFNGPMPDALYVPNRWEGPQP